MASKNKNLAELLDANGDVLLSNLDNINVYDVDTTSTGSFTLPKGTTAQRPTGSLLFKGAQRYNTELNVYEYYNGNDWLKISAEQTRLNSISGDIWTEVETTLTLTGQGFLTDDITVNFTQSSDGIDEDVTVTPSSDTSATVTVPSAVYNNVTAGNDVLITATNSDGTTSSALTKTANGIATGGTRTISGSTVTHIYTASSSSTFVAPSNITGADVLLVGAGGGGSGAFAGGGGAGGVVYASNYTISANTYNVQVGAGGTGGIGWENQDQMYGTDGGDTTGFGWTASGGGGGSSFRGGASYGTATRGVHYARDGGCGGGGSSAHSDMPVWEGGDSDQQSFSGTTTYGTDGGNGNPSANTYSVYLGGGGGGASQSGRHYNDSTRPGGGGNGIDLSSTFGTSVGDTGVFAGGGGAGNQNTAGGYGAGGTGGGTDGTNSTIKASDATANTGGGGGGGGYSGSSNSQLGGNGGSGVIIVKYTVS